MIIRATLVALALLLVLPASPASATSPADLAAVQARAAVIESVRAQLGSQLATALQTADRVAQALRDNTSQQNVLKSSIADSDARIQALDDQIAKLDLDMKQTSERIREEKSQISSLARAIYAQPSSVLLLMVESPSLGDMITRVNDLRSAGSRAQTLKSKLKDDLALLDTDLKKQQAARDEQVKLRDQKAADLAKLQDLQAKQEKAQADLAMQIGQTRYELGRVDYQSAALAQQIADILQQQEERHHRGRRVIGLEPGRDHPPGRHPDRHQRRPLDQVPVHLAPADRGPNPAVRALLVLVRAALRQLRALPHRHRHVVAGGLARPGR